METDLLKLLADYVLAAVFIVLYVRSQGELAKAFKDIAEQRREENREMRQLLFELARQGGITPVVRNARVYDTPDDWNDRPPTESKRPTGFPANSTNTGP